MRSFVGCGSSWRWEKPSVDQSRSIRSWRRALIGARQQGIKAQPELDPAAPRAMIDCVQNRQVVVNLVRNSVEAMAESDIRELVIRTRLGDGSVDVSVSDAGLGLDPAVAAKLFQPVVSTKPKDVGIGLSICRPIPQSHGIDLRVMPNPGAGVTFALTLAAA